MKRLYESAAYDTAAAVPSLWEETAPPAPETPPLESGIQADVAIIGAGYTGLNAALQLAEEHHLSTVVCDAGRPGWGASGRNGGFACLGGTTLDTAQEIARYGLTETARHRALQKAAVARVADNLSRYGIDADTHSEGELELAHNPRAFDHMVEEAAFSERQFDLSSQVIPPEGLAEIGASGQASRGQAFHGGVRLKCGFALHPLKYARGLVRAALAAGVAIHGDSPATDIRAEGDGWRIITPGGMVRARQVIFATNGYAPDDVPPRLGLRTLPLFSSIMVTRPLHRNEMQAQGWTTDLMAFDSRILLHYFRLLPDGRFLFGRRGALSADARALERVRLDVRRAFERMFPAWRGVETTHFWSGLICLTRNRHQ
ncbi:MAG: FAD-binding oxidoreductase, partial [Paracoccaceae bacterium]|nr:FAD-binding oxidoreductase [Paracoccaceae bacterium]